MIADLSLRYFSFCRVISLQQTMSGSCGRHRLLIHSARQVVQITATGEQVLTGARRMNSLAVLERRHDVQGLSIVVDRLARAVLWWRLASNVKYSLYTSSCQPPHPSPPPIKYSCFFLYLGREFCTIGRQCMIPMHPHMTVFCTWNGLLLATMQRCDLKAMKPAI